ncbi:MAG TPA: class I SAM-dependent methyltransferase [Nitrospiraceae bacterium]|nr:class I SAM-dependent methyltransferase [Nitrospiraceae bacterium]
MRVNYPQKRSTPRMSPVTEVAKVRVAVGPYERLGWYVRFEEEAYWETTWRGLTVEDARGLVSYYKDDTILLRAFLRYLPRERPILEAGCGVGQWVFLLGQMGYAMEGVDTSQSAIALARRAFGELPVRLADVTALDYPDGYLGGYVSLGVMEHFPDGPAVVLREVRRVLDRGGVLLCTVPYFNPLRRARRYLTAPVSPELRFYEWAFSRKEFTTILQDFGFKIECTMAYSPLKTLRDEFPAVRTSAERVRMILPPSVDSDGRKGLRLAARGCARICARACVRALERSTPLRLLAGHMMIYVARRL